MIVVVMILPVMFWGYASTATEGTFIAGPGIAISLVMIAIGYLLSIESKGQIERKNAWKFRLKIRRNNFTL